VPLVQAYDPGTPCWVELSTPDVERAKSFYATVFGWNYEDRAAGSGDGYFVATCNGHPAAGLVEQTVQDKAAGTAAAWMTYLAVADVHHAAEKINAAGGTIVRPPTEVPGSGRSVIAADNRGTPVGLWEAAGNIGAGIVNEPGAVVWNELQVDDVSAVLPFYSAVAGLGSSSGPAGDLDEYIRLSVAGRDVAGAMTKPSPELPNNWLVYFNTADARETAARVAGSGGGIIAPVFEVSGIGEMAVLTDPDGAVFCLMAAGSQA
jgi:predicted enzyme related to lactoylglutathione lyase